MGGACGMAAAVVSSPYAAPRRMCTGIIGPLLAGFVLGGLVIALSAQGEGGGDADSSPHSVVLGRDGGSGGSGEASPPDDAGSGVSSWFRNVFGGEAPQGVYGRDIGKQFNLGDGRARKSPAASPPATVLVTQQDGAAAPSPSAATVDTGATGSTGGAAAPPVAPPASPATPAAPDAWLPKERTPVTLPDGPTPDWLEGTAIVTMATGDAAARDALALMRSLRDVGTRVPELRIMLSHGGVGSADCHNATWKAARGRWDVSCNSAQTDAPEITSQVYLDSFAAMGVTPMIVDPIPDTPYTQVAGGRQVWWGMAFNKLLVFNMTQYRKVIWMDSDAYVVRNIAPLMREPAFTGAVVTACCSTNSPGYAGGGIWVVEPSVRLYADILAFIAKPVPGTESDPWYVGGFGWGY